jgi:small subunit ribosomal protein S8
MSCSDPIADALTVIRNGIRSRKAGVSFKHSKVKEGIVKVLKDEGYITDYEVVDTQPARTIRVALKWSADGENPIHVIRRVSTPGRRVYSRKQDLSPVIRGYGIQVVSTSKGIVSDRTCRTENIGGEILALVH